MWVVEVLQHTTAPPAKGNPLTIVLRVTVDAAHSVATVSLLGAVAAGVGSSKATGLSERELDHWFHAEFRRAAGEAPGDDRPFTVGEALDAYLAWYARHRKALGATCSAIETHVRPALGAIEAAKRGSA